MQIYREGKQMRSLAQKVINSGVRFVFSVSLPKAPETLTTVRERLEKETHTLHYGGHAFDSAGPRKKI